MFRSQEDEIMMNLLVETPQQGEPIDNLLEQLNMKVQTLLKYRPISLYAGYFYLYEINENNDYFSYWLIDPNTQTVSLYYKYYKCYNGYIITNTIMGDKNYKGLFYHFFNNIVMNINNFVESDKILTDLGYKFWEKLVNSSGYYIYVLDLENDNLEKVESSNELKDYYGPGENMKNYKFLISKNETNIKEIRELRC